METKRFIGNDLSRLYARVRREIGPDAVILGTRSLLREDADPLIELLVAGPEAAGGDALAFDLQRAMVDGTLAHASGDPDRMTVGELEDIVERERRTPRGAPPPPPAPEPAGAQDLDWFEGFVGMGEASGARGVEPPAADEGSPEADEPQIRPIGGHEGRSSVFAALLSAGIDREAADLVARAAPAEQDPRRALAFALDKHPVAYPAEHDTALITIEGPVASGRTTALMRMALDCVDAGRDAVLVAADSTRTAARAQVRTYAEVLGIEVFDAFEPAEALAVAADVPAGTCVFVDTAPGPWQTPPSGPARFRYLALPAHWQAAALDQALQACRPDAYLGAVLTFGDLATNLSPALSALVRSRLGVAFLSSGRDVTTGIGVADSFTLTSGIFSTTRGETSDGRLATIA